MQKKKSGKCNPYSGKCVTNKNAEWASLLDLVDNKSNTATVNMLKNLKEK